MDIVIKKKWYQKQLFRLIFIVTTVGLVLLVILYKLSTTQISIPINEINFTTVDKGLFRPTIAVSGRVMPANTVYIDAVSGGQVQEIKLESGSKVAAGDTILVLGNTSLLLTVMSNQANLIEQQTNIRNTRLAIEQNSLDLAARLMRIENELAETVRLKNQYDSLFERGYISSNEYHDMKEEHDYLVRLREMTKGQVIRDSVFQQQQIQALQSSEKKINENLTLAEASLDALVIRAPESGLLVQMDVRVGESIVPGQRLAQVDGEDGFKVIAQLDEYYLSDIFTGLTAEMQKNGQTHTLSVMKVHPEVNNGRFNVEFEFANAIPSEIKRGQTVHMKLFTGGDSEALLLKRGPFYDHSGGNWVYVISEDRREAVKKNIKLGRQNIHEFELLDGLSEGDRVIISSYENYNNKPLIKLEND